MRYVGVAALGLLGILALSTNASAAVVCNEEGVPRSAANNDSISVVF
jgi:hypothetical protein